MHEFPLPRADDKIMTLRLLPTYTITPYFTLVTTRGQRSILRLTTNPTRGQYHSNGTTLINFTMVFWVFFRP